MPCCPVGGGCRAEAGGDPKLAALKNPVPANAASIKAGAADLRQELPTLPRAARQGRWPAGAEEPEPANLTDDKWDHGSSDGEIYTIILQRRSGADVGDEGDEGHVDATQIWHVVNYIRSIGPKPPRPAPRRNKREDSGRLFLLRRAFRLGLALAGGIGCQLYERNVPTPSTAPVLPGQSSGVFTTARPSMARR